MSPLKLPQRNLNCLFLSFCHNLIYFGKQYILVRKKHIKEWFVSSFPLTYFLGNVDLLAWCWVSCCIKSLNVLSLMWINLSTYYPQISLFTQNSELLEYDLYNLLFLKIIGLEKNMNIRNIFMYVYIYPQINSR